MIFNVFLWKRRMGRGKREGNKKCEKLNCILLVKVARHLSLSKSLESSSWIIIIKTDRSLSWCRSQCMQSTYSLPCTHTEDADKTKLSPLSYFLAPLDSVIKMVQTRLCHCLPYYYVPTPFRKNANRHANC